MLKRTQTMKRNVAAALVVLVTLLTGSAFAQDSGNATSFNKAPQQDYRFLTDYNP